MSKRLFISFAKEDQIYRDGIVKQARDERSPFVFTDMSVKQPWDSAWKTNCRTKIRGCDGMIAMISRNTLTADGAIWEINCAKEEGLPVLGIHIFKDSKVQMPGVRIVDWNWINIANFINSLG